METKQISSLKYLDQIEELFLESSRIPLSGCRLVNEQEVIELIDSLRDSIPKEVKQASMIIEEANYLINSSRKKAEEILQQAREQKNKILDSYSIKEEAEKQIAEFKVITEKKCEQLINNAMKKSAKIEIDMTNNKKLLDQEYTLMKENLENTLNERRQRLEREAEVFKRTLTSNHQNNYKKAVNEIEEMRNKAVQEQRNSKIEVERIYKDVIAYRNDTRDKCDQLIKKSQIEAQRFQEGANNYADITLRELEQKVQKISKVLRAGRKELEAISNNKNNRDKPKVRDQKRNINL